MPEDKELHLFIIWKSAEPAKPRILEDIGSRFEILNIFEIHWSRDMFSENMSRFYGQKLPPDSSKEIHCGVGPFTLVIVADNSPLHEVRETTSGRKRVNINLFDAKTLYREWTGGGHKIHATDTPAESSHDITLLLGINPDDFVEKRSLLDSSQATQWKHDLMGARGWNSIEELFYVLNSTIDYVVLRNFEALPGAYNLDGHGDIDLLVADYKEALWIANAEAVFKDRYRVHNKINIKGQEILFDFRHVGDNYYDKEWEKNILKHRVLHSDCFYKPGDEDYFYSLLYHGLVHKPKLSVDYAERLGKLAGLSNVKAFEKKYKRGADELILILGDYLQASGYKYKRPNDLSVYYNELRPCPLQHIMPSDAEISCQCLEENNGEEYWSRVYHYKNIIIKQASRDLAIRESVFLGLFSNDYFPHLISSKTENDYSVIEMEKIQGTLLTDCKDDLSVNLDQLITFIQHCLYFLKELTSHGVTHRDIRPENILVRNGKPVLIDFGWAISDNHVYFTPAGLGSTGRPPDGSFCDVYSLGKVFSFLNEHRYPTLDYVIDMMIETKSALRVTNIEILKLLFDVIYREKESNDDGNIRTLAGPAALQQSDTGSYQKVIISLLEEISKRNRLLRENENNEWTGQYENALEDIALLIPAGDTFILVDDAQWGLDGSVSSRKVIPFLERNGKYWGAPPDDETAIQELQRLRQAAADYMVFAWPAFWWLDHYQGLKKYLDLNHRCLLKNDRVIIFDLHQVKR